MFKDPNLPSALALREQFSTPAAVATASLSALQATRSGHHPSNAKLAELQSLAAQSIGTKDPSRLRGLVFEQQQLIQELAFLDRHLEQLEAEIIQVVAHAREGQILTSIPGIGLIQAAAIIASIGTIANFSRPAQLKSYFGWVPKVTQSGSALDRARLSPRGTRLMKQTLYLIVWQAIRIKGSEWASIYSGWFR